MKPVYLTSLVVLTFATYLVAGRLQMVNVRCIRNRIADHEMCNNRCKYYGKELVGCCLEFSYDPNINICHCDRTENYRDALDSDDYCMGLRMKELLKNYKEFDSEKVQITFYEKDQYLGDSYTLALASDYCYNTPLQWSNRFASVNTNYSCVRVYSEGECNGEFFEVAPRTKCHGSFDNCGFHHKVSSVKLC